MQAGHSDNGPQPRQRYETAQYQLQNDGPLVGLIASVAYHFDGERLTIMLIHRHNEKG